MSAITTVIVLSILRYCHLIQAIQVDTTPQSPTRTDEVSFAILFNYVDNLRNMIENNGIQHGLKVKELEERLTELKENNRHLETVLQEHTEKENQLRDQQEERTKELERQVDELGDKNRELTKTLQENKTKKTTSFDSQISERRTRNSPGRTRGYLFQYYCNLITLTLLLMNFSFFTYALLYNDMYNFAVHWLHNQLVNSADPDETAPAGAVSSGSSLFTGIRGTELNIAFTAYLDHVISHAGLDQSIVFNRVLLNDGGAYSNVTGAFTVPITGVYSFTFYVGQKHVNEFVVSLMVNGQHKLEAIVETIYSTQDQQGGNTAVLELNQGDVVQIRHINQGLHLEGSDSLRITTFSGFLLYPIEKLAVVG